MQAFWRWNVGSTYFITFPPQTFSRYCPECVCVLCVGHICWMWGTGVVFFCKKKKWGPPNEVIMVSRQNDFAQSKRCQRFCYNAVAGWAQPARELCSSTPAELDLAKHLHPHISLSQLYPHLPSPIYLDPPRALSHLCVAHSLRFSDGSWWLSFSPRFLFAAFADIKKEEAAESMVDNEVKAIVNSFGMSQTWIEPKMRRKMTKLLFWALQFVYVSNLVIFTFISNF